MMLIGLPLAADPSDTLALYDVMGLALLLSYDFIEQYIFILEKGSPPLV